MTVMGEAQIREAFRELSDVKNSHERKQSLVKSISRSITSPEYRNGEIATLVDGGLKDTGNSNLPTGIIPVTSLRDLHHKYSEIDWDALIREGEGVIPGRLVYVARVIKESFDHRTWEPLPVGKQDLHVLHLNTYNQVPLFSEFSRQGVEAQTLTSFSFPAIYVSRLEMEESGFRLSQCSMDIYEDRANRQLSYDRGLIYQVDPEQVFLIDRKVNIAYQNEFIKCVVSEEIFSEFEPNEEEVRDHAQALSNLSQQWANVEPERLFESTIELAEELRFSILGFCMFEATHEYIMQYVNDVNVTNKLLILIDSSQKDHWSMRGFKLPGVSSLKEILESQEIADMNFHSLSRYFQRHLNYKLRAFLGDKLELADDCAYNSLFQEPLHLLEKDDPAFSFSSAPLSDATKIPRDVELPSGINIDRHRSRIVFETIAMDHSASHELHDILDEHIESSEVDTIVHDQRYKHAFLRFRETMGANTLRVLLANNVGCLAVPFQPDPRGELLLLPLATFTLGNGPGSQNELEAKLATLKKKDGYIFVEQMQKIPAPVLIRDLGILDPVLRQAPNNLYSTLAPSKAGAYQQVYEQVKSAADASLEAQISQLPIADNWIAIVIPFFKEINTYSEIVLETIARFSGRDNGIVFIMVSNQQPAQFMKNIATLQGKALEKANEAGISHGIIALNTAEVSIVQHWMVEKFVNVHLGAYAVNKLIDNSIPVEYTVFVEGDIRNFEKWWDSILPVLDRHLSAVVLFDHVVITQEENIENTPLRPTYDTSDAILSKLFASPLTEVLLGVGVEQILGGNFILSKEALRDFLELLDSSTHVESLVEAWLPSIFAMTTNSCTVVNVPPKVHLPAVSDTYSTDNKTVKYVADLFYSFERYLDMLPATENLELYIGEGETTLFDVDNSDMEIRKMRMDESDFVREIWRNVLGPDLSNSHEEVLKAVNDYNASGGASEMLYVNDDDWTETVVKFFLHTLARRAQEPEELFALKFLFDVRLLGLYLSRQENVDINPSEECLSWMRNLVSEQVRVTVNPANVTLLDEGAMTA